MKIDKALLEAERVSAIVNDPQYKATIGAWLAEEIQYATMTMSQEDDPVKNAKARGSFLALQGLVDRVNACLQRVEKAKEKLIVNMSKSED